jgi:transcription elongation GreA/GreB family factor
LNTYKKDREGNMANTNADSVIRFRLDGAVLERKLITQAVEDIATELNAQSPVGQALLTALPGEVHRVETPGGELVVEVLSVEAVSG